ncbi:hypothetical protein K435DRAFT_874942 [Dendrothele bispora CBS 962.96]|uniref:C2H2-type domain-containing protein n=1 Tax=Dendrothele bispora (strain CBS 962.96) TaxID=1314807 RepID=A0A4S8KVN5_DENBC|nr:hypothetical protein K435DRAFT_874942 [Dendrothele bispora CBS 962.96]
MPRKSIHPRNVLCPIEGCNRLFINQQGITTHIRNEHGRLKRSGPPGNRDQPSGSRSDYLLHHHNNSEQSTAPDSPNANDSFCSSSPVNSPPTRTPELEPESEPEGLYTEEIHPFLNGRPCDAEGNYLASGAPPPPFDPPSDDYYPTPLPNLGNLLGSDSDRAMEPDPLSLESSATSRYTLISDCDSCE